MVETKNQAIAQIYGYCDRPTATRVRKLVKAVYDFDATNDEIIEFIEHVLGGKIERQAIERHGIDKDFPDVWTFYNEAFTATKQYRRIWGDKLMQRLSQKFLDPEADVWAWRNELLAATASIESRRSVNWENPDRDGGELAQKFTDTVLIVSIIRWAIMRQFESAPDPQAGIQFPVVAPGYWEAKEAKYKADALTRAWATEAEAIAYFRQFWQVVFNNRGPEYAENLHKGFGYVADSGRYYKGFYGSTELNFRWFLENLEGFKRKAPYRLPRLRDVEARLPMVLEGSIQKYGWEAVLSFANWAYLGADRE